MSKAQTQEATDGSEASQRIREYTLDSENIATSVRVRPTGFVAWLKAALFGIGVTHWFVTNQRLIEDRRFWGGFRFQDISHEKVASIEYGSKLPLSILGLGILLVVTGVFLIDQVGDVAAVLIFFGLLVILLAFYRRKQVLTVHGSGGAELSLRITRGTQVDELLVYLHAARNQYHNS